MRALGAPPALADGAQQRALPESARDSVAWAAPDAAAWRAPYTALNAGCDSRSPARRPPRPPPCADGGARRGSWASHGPGDAARGLRDTMGAGHSAASSAASGGRHPARTVAGAGAMLSPGSSFGEFRGLRDAVRQLRTEAAAAGPGRARISLPDPAEVIAKVPSLSRSRALCRLPRAPPPRLAAPARPAAALSALARRGRPPHGSPSRAAAPPRPRPAPRCPCAARHPRVRAAPRRLPRAAPRPRQRACRASTSARSGAPPQSSTLPRRPGTLRPAAAASAAARGRSRRTESCRMPRTRRGAATRTRGRWRPRPPSSHRLGGSRAPHPSARAGRPAPRPAPPPARPRRQLCCRTPRRRRRRQLLRRRRRRRGARMRARSPRRCRRRAWASRAAGRRGGRSA